jgi:hypothetical protein
MKDFQVMTHEKTISRMILWYHSGDEVLKIKTFSEKEFTE